jgi:hypothetical protein
MKIKEVIDTIIPEKKPNALVENLGENLGLPSSSSESKMLNHSLIRSNLSKIQESEEFEDSEVIVVSRPLLEEIGSGRAFNVLTIKIGEGLKFKNKCYLYSLESSMHGVIARGLFESYEYDGEINHDENYDIDLESEPKFGIVFYIEKNGDTDDITSMKMKTKTIPIGLQEAYYDKFGTSLSSVTEEMIDEFLKENAEK